MLPTEVRNYDDLCEKIAEINAAHPDACIVYRGQTSWHEGKLQASIDRAEGRTQNPAFKSWERTISKILFEQVRSYLKFESERGQSPEEDIGAPAKATSGTLESHIQSVLQHYGAPSTFIDVSKSLEVALWFAHHRFCAQEAPLLPDDIPARRHHLDLDSALPLFDVAWYEPIADADAQGFLFVLKPTVFDEEAGLQHADLVQLGANKSSARMQAQDAALIYVDPETSDIQRLVLAAFQFPLPLAGAPKFVTDASTMELFPSPRQDRLYAEILCSVPFVEKLDLPFQRQRPIRILEYFDREEDFLFSPEWAEYREVDHYLAPTFLFPAIAGANADFLRCKLRGHTLHLREAAAFYSREAADEWQPAGDETLDLELQTGKAPVNIFYEFGSPKVLLRQDARFVLKFLSRSKDSPGAVDISLHIYDMDNIRGIWFVGVRDRFWCRLFGHDPDSPADHIWHTLGHEFERAPDKSLKVRDRVKSDTEDAYHARVEAAALTYVHQRIAEIAIGRRATTDHPILPFTLID